MIGHLIMVFARTPLRSHGEVVNPAKVMAQRLKHVLVKPSCPYRPEESESEAECVLTR